MAQRDTFFNSADQKIARLCSMAANFDKVATILLNDFRNLSVYEMTKMSQKLAKVAKQTPAKKTAEKQSTAKKARPRKSVPNTSSRRAAKPKLLSGGNPQIAKAAGDAPVQAYIAAMPGWKRAVGERLDEIISRAVPGVHKAVKWNSPMYGEKDQPEGKRGSWFLGIHCMTKSIKVAFFRGASLRPVPPGESKQKEVRYLDIHVDDEVDESQFAKWVKQASQLPGELM
ncbi:MAG: DUF1801 domain-containing protein [Pirellulales bacterium]|nr:DUF1801 domain-containing protein [Pirellulales bacterium]